MKRKKTKDLIVEIGRLMYDRGLLSACDGNISVRLNDNEIWTTPSGVCKGMMDSEMLVRTDISGNVIEGGKPSSELKMHLQVYCSRPDIFAVVHAHPVYACAFASSGKALDKNYFTENIITLGEVPLAEYATPSTEEVAKSVEPYLKDYKALLLAHHGALSWGKDLPEAYFLMESLENTAKSTFIAEQTGSAREIAPDKVAYLKKIMGK